MEEHDNPSEANIDEIVETIVDIAIRDVIISAATSEGAIPLYGRENRKEPCRCCKTDDKLMCTTSDAIGILSQKEVKEWCSEIVLVPDGRCERARKIKEAAKECKEKYPHTAEFWECYAPAFSKITRGLNPGVTPVTPEVTISETLVEQVKRELGITEKVVIARNPEETTHTTFIGDIAYINITPRIETKHPFTESDSLLHELKHVQQYFQGKLDETEAMKWAAANISKYEGLAAIPKVEAGMPETIIMKGANPGVPVSPEITEPPYRIYDRKRPGEPIEPDERYGAETLLPSGKYRRIGLFASRDEALKAIQKTVSAISKAEASMPPNPGEMTKMPRINPHATAIQQDKQTIEQIKWLKAHGFKTARNAQEAGY